MVVDSIVNVKLAGQLKEFWLQYSRQHQSIFQGMTQEGLIGMCLDGGFGLGLRLMVNNPEYAQALFKLAVPQGGVLAIDFLPELIPLEGIEVFNE